MSPPVIDLFWSFRSPYSYLALPGARDMLARQPAAGQVASRVSGRPSLHSGLNCASPPGT